METYDYLENVKEDVKEVLEENYSEQLEELKNDEINADWFASKLHDDLFVDDCVTGNASGSYFCNSYNVCLVKATKARVILNMQFEHTKNFATILQ